MNVLQTEFAPAERAEMSVIQRQAAVFTNLDPLVFLADAAIEYILVLNNFRQIVFANLSFTDFIKIENRQAVYGKRPGEAVNCINACLSEEGCGTTGFCRECGAANTILQALTGKPAIMECHILRRPDKNIEAIDCLAHTTPFNYRGEDFAVLTWTNISDQNRRKILERTFFHDIMNIAGPLKGFADLLISSETEKKEKYAGFIKNISERLFDEIEAQRSLLAAENNELAINAVQINSKELAASVISLFHDHTLAGNKYIVTRADFEEIQFKSDRALIHRVLVNMLKNALEATVSSDTVTIGCINKQGKVLFSVHNPGVIPKHVQMQIFKRSFSTKGNGRGIGTYSMKLLCENYLGGTVYFTSCPETGTTFTAEFPLNL